MEIETDNAKEVSSKNCEDVINSAAGKVRIERFPICLCVYAGNYASDALLRPKKKKKVYCFPFAFSIQGEGFFRSKYSASASLPASVLLEKHPKP